MVVKWKEYSNVVLDVVSEFGETFMRIGDDTIRCHMLKRIFDSRGYDDSIMWSYWIDFVEDIVMIRKLESIDWNPGRFDEADIHGYLSFKWDRRNTIQNEYHSYGFSESDECESEIDYDSLRVGVFCQI